jgi:hypothetical protein
MIRDHRGHKAQQDLQVKMDKMGKMELMVKPAHKAPKEMVAMKALKGPQVLMDKMGKMVDPEDLASKDHKDQQVVMEVMEDLASKDHKD